jgi:3',5'-cyclic-AMP phosphodiesterase
MSMDERSCRRELHHRGSCVTVAQITDMHLGAERGARLAGMDTDASLALVVAMVKGAARKPDLILATGDLSMDGSAASYRRVREVLDDFQVPWFWLPGNHDDAAVMRATLSDTDAMVRSVLIGGWQIILLDSTVPGRVGGSLGTDELQQLDALLRERPAAHALVCLHHQPVPIGCAWLDEQKVVDAAQLLALLDGHPHVRGVLWGHVHQEFERRMGNFDLLSAPSTCIQFAAGSARFRLAALAPGMRWLELHADGRIDTQVQRVQGFSLEYDRNSSGYD